VPFPRQKRRHIVDIVSVMKYEGRRQAGVHSRGNLADDKKIGSNGLLSSGTVMPGYIVAPICHGTNS